jgi:adenylate cyclase
MSSVVRLSSRARIVLVIAGCWTFALLITYVNTWMLIRDLTAMGKLQGTYAFFPDFAGTLTIGLIGGLLNGYLLVYKVNASRRRRSFMTDIVRSGLLFILVYLAAGLVMTFSLAFAYNAFHTDIASAIGAGWDNVRINLYTPSFVATMFVWGLLASCTQFMLQVNDKFGPGILWKLITGRYYRPREEERIFMFLDLQSSTSIAESLGHKRYFELLRDLYEDITGPITECEGEIYQYVGDEVVITWPPVRGIQGANCVRCFFRIQHAIERERLDYLQRFGVAPVFKAGVHVGPAMVGEIGVVKKDIVFSGDVLNTTARIQAECNRHGVNLLASSDLLRLVPLAGAFDARPIGEIALRGKAEPLALSEVRVGTWAVARA